MALRFKSYIKNLVQLAGSASLALGLLLGLLVLITGGVEGSVSFDIDISRRDSVWFVLAIPVVLTLLFLVVSPLSALLYHLAFRRDTGKTEDDI
jgi:hypothetical protein